MRSWGPQNPVEHSQRWCLEMADDKPYTRRKHSREKGKTNSDKCSFVNILRHIVSRNAFGLFPLANSTAENVAQRSKSCKQGVVRCDAQSLLACPLNSIFSFVTHLSWLQTRRKELSFVQKNYLDSKNVLGTERRDFVSWCYISLRLWWYILQSDNASKGRPSTLEVSKIYHFLKDFDLQDKTGCWSFISRIF